MQPNDQNSVQPQQQLYPTPVSGPLAAAQPGMVFSNDSQDVDAVKQPYSRIGIVFLILLILTFFTPLGSSLFFPLLIVGAAAAFNSTARAQKSSIAKTGRRSPFITIIRTILIIGATIALIIVALIAFFFIGIATGLIKINLNFGS
jgi:hypothetical protein